MGKIENALKTFNLDANFTHEQLEKAYSLKSKMLYVDFGNKKEDTIRREQDSYDYQILIMYEYLRTMFKDIDLEKKGLFNISKSAKEFYEKENSCMYISCCHDSSTGRMWKERRYF